jgi:putative NIF3 family GTP cyclohydrolase 1 type 2
LSFDNFIRLVEKKIGKPNFVFSFGNKKVKRVAVCSGGAASSVREAHGTGAQVFLTGEAREDSYIFCREEAFNFIAAGHNNTEVFGPVQLADYLSKKEKVPTKFINFFNPV